MRIEFFINCPPESLQAVLTALFAVRDGTVAKNVHFAPGACDVTAYGTWESYKRVADLPNGTIYSLEHFHDE